MANSTEDRSAPTKAGNVVSAEVKGDQTLYAGTMVAVDTTTGLAEPAADKANIRVIGHTRTRAFGGDMVEAHRDAVAMDNDDTNPVTAANIGENCYVIDDKTVSSNGGINNVVAGIVVSIEDGQVFVAQK